MKTKYIKINCQEPPCSINIKRVHWIAQCEVQKGNEDYLIWLQRAKTLASRVNKAAANTSTEERNEDRLILDAFGGVLAEEGWINLINHHFGVITRSAPFISAAQQIDIELEQGERIEIRSSFPRNGVKFAICNSRSNFKNIGPYSNTVKPGEIQKHLYLGVLFDTSKSSLLDEKTIKFSLVGGSTWKMMAQEGLNGNLMPDGSAGEVDTNYRYIPWNAALDVLGVRKAIEALGYKRII